MKANNLRYFFLLFHLLVQRAELFDDREKLGDLFVESLSFFERQSIELLVQVGDCLCARVGLDSFQCIPELLLRFFVIFHQVADLGCDGSFDGQDYNELGLRVSLFPNLVSTIRGVRKVDETLERRVSAANIGLHSTLPLQVVRRVLKFWQAEEFCCRQT